ncbi:hypothetical protein SJ05684_c02110 [Sinorhizobium sojae CCBAU 05684]|uniref:Uncharacterized protein n=1 Tax=Sinorhizobium sojae CCBAU 05684 TaxID=716928 RepID=A0A249P6W6_9HYPH|nr:hypothetical protein SJ05684_c02110 [Sinorhizobium sojae CCBAU 05684]
MLSSLGRLIQIHREQPRRFDSGLRQKLDTARRSGRQYQFLGHCH